MKWGLAIAALALGSLPFSASGACTKPTSTANSQANGNGGVQTTSTTSGPNFGFYEWSEASQSWLLADQAWLVEAESETLLEGDYYFPPSTYNGGGGGGGGGGGEVPVEPQGNGGKGRVVMASCDEPTDLPPVVVTGRRPSTSSIMLMFRPPAFRSGGGGIGRPRVGGVKQADPNLTCSNSSDDERKLAALAVLPPFVPNLSIWLVRYAPGRFQMWQVTAPRFSDRGLQPYGRCVGG